MIFELKEMAKELDISIVPILKLALSFFENVIIDAIICINILCEEFMKLFKHLLVAPAALGLLAPMSVIASEVNLDAVSNYTDGDLEIDSNSFSNYQTVSPLLAGGEGLVDNGNYSTDSFSETTTASFSADMYLGAVDGGSSTADDAVNATYSYQIDLTTSFTGEDSLDVAIKAGTSGAAGTAEFDGNSAGDGLVIDGLSYTFPLGDKTTFFVGDNVDGSLLYNTACVYGGPSNTLDACGNVSAAFEDGEGTAAGASFEIGNGFTGAVGYTGAGTTTSGLLTKEGNDSFGGQISYAADSYGASVTYANVESTDDTAYWALNGYWTPSDFASMPSVSVGYEIGNPTTAKDNTSYFVGLQWDEFGPGTFGTAIGTKTPTTDGETALLMYEAFYSYAFNDGMTITPLIYIKEFATGTDDETGVMVKSSFSF